MTGVLEGILANMKTALSQISIAGGYNFDVKNVFTDFIPYPDRGPDVNITIYVDSFTKDTTGFTDQNGYRECVAEFVIEGVIGESVAEKRQPQLLKLLDDIEKALAVDGTRGGLAHITDVTAGEIVHEMLIAGIAICACKAKVKYDHQYTNPAQAY